LIHRLLPGSFHNAMNDGRQRHGWSAELAMGITCPSIARRNLGLRRSSAKVGMLFPVLIEI
jgi:hypothetical protein